MKLLLVSVQCMNAFHVRRSNHLIETVFIYTCPPSSKLREKMLYSSSRNGVVATAEKEADIKVAKKVRNK
jgi:hypothetical protein